ncbi:hypothetical protein XccvBFoX7_gp99c [Xanthomonas phage FoX7]|uniref:Uncharacterized protein n=2 Tax=Carpasinavirus XcP1 TaxID=2182344 RepID=A0A858NYA3_9CAUD|nr:hypothetical protein XccvBFoX6_gp99c [Xanthomonas phage FoX6]QJB22256.1 hypothetical protein XccvBFoX7_gp99c [Xanthomonas phage FoX7]
MDYSLLTGRQQPPSRIPRIGRRHEPQRSRHRNHL